jgi:UDP-N-acetylmuramoylalanine--D-glutamate ligase
VKNYKEYFRGKKITIMGLGLLGGALNDAIFLADCGAELTITDLKSEKELAPSIKKLSKYPPDRMNTSVIRAGKNIKYVLGRHDIEDFKQADFILQPGNVPVNSPYLLEAQKNNIPIHESESLFMQYADGVRVVGITGTRGKSTTTALIYEILESAFGPKVYLAGNVKGKSTLALLKDIKGGDIVVLEMDSWCLHGLGEIKKSPQISVFTNLMPDHLNFYLKDSKDEGEAMEKYFTDKAQIYLHQKTEDYLICGEKIAPRIGKINSQKIIAKKASVPKNWKIKIPGDHNLENIACAIAVAGVLKIDEKIIKKAVEKFTGVEGRLQLIREYKGIEIYNDTTATTPDATIMALRALGVKKNIVLILGGADKSLDMSALVKEIPKYCKSTVWLAGSGTDKICFKKDFIFDNLIKAVEKAVGLCKRGDILLFSPAFASFGMFKNEYDRGDKFMKLIKGLK